MRKQFINAVLGSFVFIIASNPAAGVSYNVEDIVDDGNPANVDTGKKQFFIDVTDYGSSQVLFTFRNAGPLASSITQIYFEKGSRTPLKHLNSITYLMGQLAFSQATGNLGRPPGAQNINWGNKGTEFRADAGSPVPKNGIGPGESLGLVFSLSTGFTFNNVISDLDTSAWRICFHAQSFSGEGNDSDTFVLGDPIQTVPDTTSTLAALSCSLLLLLGARRKLAC